LRAQDSDLIPEFEKGGFTFDFLNEELIPEETVTRKKSQTFQFGQRPKVQTTFPENGDNDER